jgi:hypothetical protein
LAGTRDGFCEIEMLDTSRLDERRLAYSISEFAAAVGLSPQTIRNLGRDGDLTILYPTASRSKAIILREEGLRWLHSLPRA